MKKCYSGVRTLHILPFLILCAISASTQTMGKAPSLTMAAVPPVTAERTKQTRVSLNFRVPTDIVLGKIEYPAGEDLSFPFSPDEKLNVYSGDFSIALSIHPLHSVVPGKYVMHGTLRYQACDNDACYPP